MFAGDQSRQVYAYQRGIAPDASAQYLPQAFPMMQNNRIPVDYVTNVAPNPVPFVPQRLDDSGRLQMFHSQQQQNFPTPMPMQSNFTMPQQRSQSFNPDSTLRIINAIGSTVRHGQKYIDVAHAPGLEMVCTDGNDPPGTLSFKKPSAKTFPEKLHALLTLAESDPSLQAVISFSPHGRAFQVHNIKKFCDETAPQYFQRLGQWKSFTRQLNLYGFTRIPHGADAGAYFHEL